MRRPGAKTLTLTIVEPADVMQRAKGKKGAAQEASSRSWRQAEEEEQTGEAGSEDYEEEDEEDLSAEGSSDQVSRVCC